MKVKKIDILEKEFKKRKIIYTSDLLSMGIDKKYLQIAIDKDICVKISRGIYCDIDTSFDSYYIEYVKHKSSCYTLESSLILHEYIDLVYAKKTFISDKKYEDKKIDFLKGNTKVGSIYLSTVLGNKVKTFDIERIICDMIYYKDLVDTEIYSKVLQKYMTSNKKDLNKIMNYSKQLNYGSKVKDIMEVFYAWQ